jgi:hypothetical protein
MRLPSRGLLLSMVSRNTLWIICCSATEGGWTRRDSLDSFFLTVVRSEGNQCERKIQVVV